MPADGGAGAGFDQYAAAYDEALRQGLRLTGESKAHYAERRVRWLRSTLGRCGISACGRVLDFGCGDGDAAPLLRELLGAGNVTGVDASPAMIALAARRHPWATFGTTAELPHFKPFDAAYCNGVFHHVPTIDRLGAARAVYDALRPGGVFGFWENHPWNPGTRMVMRRIPFDHDAVLLSPSGARRLLRQAGFTIVRTDHLFIFPAWLSALRPLERFVSRLPIGGQYQVLAQRPR
jgi:SAM-dependent methyltransferase